jgi:hypothetical protein
MTRQMKATVDALDESHDSVIIDSPPILLVADSLELAKLVSDSGFALWPTPLA